MGRRPNIILKTEEELERLRKAGKILAEIICELRGSLTSGMSTQDVNQKAERLIRDKKVVPAFKGYRGFPASVCVSVNNEVVHGIPGKRILREGDIVSLDVGIVYQGYYSDTAVSVGIGPLTDRRQDLLDVTEASLEKGIAQAVPGRRLSDISHAIQTFVEKHGFSVVRDFVGHGIGKSLHEDPEIANFGDPNKGPVLKSGMVFAIEPMVNMGSWKTRIESDGWTVVTADGQPSAHFEHTVAITDQGPEILTK